MLTPSSLSFDALPEKMGDATIVRLPEIVSAGLPSRGLVMASFMLAGHHFVAPLEPDGLGGHFLQVPGDVAPALTTQAYPLALDVQNDWPEPDMPPDMMDAIHAAGLTQMWQSLTVKARWEWLRWMRATKNPATRAKRITVACDKLQKGDRRPCCFNSASCTIPQLCPGGALPPQNAQIPPQKA